MSIPEPLDPTTEYANRLAARRAAAAKLSRGERAISAARLAIFVIAAGLAWLWWGEAMIGPVWLAVPALAFAVMVIVHERVIQARRRLERAAIHYQRCLARLDHRWMGEGEAGLRFLDADHLFAADLDLFGPGSLFELICTARTRAGEETLASWLRLPSPPSLVRERQAAVQELRDRIDLREDLALLGDEVRAGVDPDALAAWARQPASLTSRAVKLAAAALPLLGVGTLAAWLGGVTGYFPFIAALAIEGLFALPLRARVRHVVGAVEKSGRDLSLLSEALGRLERERFAAPLLVRLRAELDTEGKPPSWRIARLRRLIELLDARRNQLFSPIGYLLLWSTQLAHAIESWRVISGPAVPRWLAAVGEIEALCALAGYAYENPDDPFPEIAEGGALFEAEALGHPLLPRRRCVRNDLRLGSDKRVLIVSGSNMSGKSTLLRTVGVNTVLALAGAPVRAGRLRLSPLAVGASIRVQDSLQAGTSRFYAEITRLRKIVDLTRDGSPVIFLIDEMLHGTNSHDRRIGAEAVVRGLVDRRAIGLVTTHDLALAHIAEALGREAGNVHFEDHLEDGRITFDYIMRPGVVRKSNALELMRAVGLDVGDPEEQETGGRPSS